MPLRVLEGLRFRVQRVAVVISRVISRATVLETHIRGLITLLIITHEPPSSSRRVCCRRRVCMFVRTYVCTCVLYIYTYVYTHILHSGKPTIVHVKPPTT